MIVNQARNVQQAYIQGLALVRHHGVREETRNGPALVIPCPVMTVYERPAERVLLDPSRDANPFFHLLESMWMLAGRNDVASLEPFNAGLKTYSDDGKRYHGAYGFRWRQHFDQDQLHRIIELLRANPGDRRVVLSMWDPNYDLGQQGADFPCNTQIYFRTRETQDGGMIDRVLDMTVMCRSNDAVWGAYGANAVHFSVLQEFVAAACGFSMGTLYQLSNNLHGYVEALDKVGEPCWPITWAKGGNQYRYTRGVPLGQYMDSEMDEYRAREVEMTPLFRRNQTADIDQIFSVIEDFWDDTLDGANHDSDVRRGVLTSQSLLLLSDVRNAYRCFKSKDREAARQHVSEMPEKSDWRRACGEWLERRYVGK